MLALPPSTTSKMTSAEDRDHASLAPVNNIEDDERHLVVHLHECLLVRLHAPVLFGACLVFYLFALDDEIDRRRTWRRQISARRSDLKLGAPTRLETKKFCECTIGKGRADIP